MINIEEFIKNIEYDIELLTDDLNNCKYDISRLIIQNNINNRRDRINELKEKYL